MRRLLRGGFFRFPTTEKFRVELTPALLFWGYMVPMALVLAALTISIVQQNDKNAALDAGIDANARVLAIEKRQDVVEAAQAKARRELVAAADRAICERSNVDRDITADLLLRFISQAATPEEKQRTREFFADALKRLGPIDCNNLPSAAVVP